MAGASDGPLLVIDGAFGEGGGQILRSALALSLFHRQPFRIYNIRKARSRPGLQPQHLMAVKAAATVGAANVEGAKVGSRELIFRPGPVQAGHYEFDIGTAGSTSLVLETVLPALLCAPQESQLIIRGGTHNPYAPPYEFLAHAFLPLLRSMGPQVTLQMARPGYYPKGGGCIIARIEPATRLAQLAIEQRGALRRRQAVATLSHLPEHIARRELNVLRRELELSEAEIRVYQTDTAYGQGNYLTVTLESEYITEVFTGFGERGVRAETVAHRLAEEVKTYLDAVVPVGEHLADQLLLPMALAGGGSFVTLRPTLHTTTNLWIIGRFLDIRIEQLPLDEHCWRIALGASIHF